MPVLEAAVATNSVPNIPALGTHRSTLIPTKDDPTKATDAATDGFSCSSLVVVFVDRSFGTVVGGLEKADAFTIHRESKIQRKTLFIS